MQQGGDSVQLLRVDGTVVVDFVDVGTTASQHPGKGDNSNALSLYFLPDEVADVQSFHFRSVSDGYTKSVGSCSDLSCIRYRQTPP